MGNYVQVSVSSGADQTALPMVCSILDGTSESSFSARFTGVVTLVTGESPSTAKILIPVNEFPIDEMQLISARRGGPGDILLRRRAKCGFLENGQYVPLIAGTILIFGHDIGKDYVTATLYSDRWLLTRYSVFGRTVWDSANERYYFDADSPLRFNNFGMPDAMDGEGASAVFAPSYRYGWKTSDTTEPDRGVAYDRSRSWTVADGIDYGNAQYATSSNRPSHPFDYGQKKLTSYVRWGSNLSNFNGSDRLVSDLDLDKHSLMSYLQTLGRHAGSVDLYDSPAGGGYESFLSFVDLSPTSSEYGIELILPDADMSIESALSRGDVIHSGTINESAINLMDQTSCLYDAPVCERMVSTDSADSDFLIDGQVGLEYAWSTEDFVAFQKYLDDNPEEWQTAINAFPTVLCSYRIPAGVNPFFGTKWSHTPVGGAHPRIMPHQLTAVNFNESNPSNMVFKEIIVEYKMSANEIAQLTNPADRTNPDIIWRVATPFDHLTLSPDGTIIFLRGLRDTKTDLPPADAGQTWYVDYRGPSDPDYSNIHRGSSIHPREIRIQLAIKHDVRIYAQDSADYNGVGSRLTGEAFNYLTVGKELDGIDWVRSDASRPNGQAGIDAAYRTDPFPAGTIFSDLESGRIEKRTQARQRDVCRIDHSGNIVIHRLNPAITPGMPIKIGGKNALAIRGIAKSVIFNGLEGTTTIQIGDPDPTGVISGPKKYVATPLASVGGGSKTHKYKDSESGYEPSKQTEQQHYAQASSPSTGDDYAYGGNNSSGSEGDKSNEAGANIGPQQDGDSPVIGSRKSSSYEGPLRPSEPKDYSLKPQNIPDYRPVQGPPNQGEGYDKYSYHGDSETMGQETAKERAARKNQKAPAPATTASNSKVETEAANRRRVADPKNTLDE